MSVREDAKYIALHAKDVHVDIEKCHEIAKDINRRMRERNYTPATWSTHKLNPHFTDANVVDWIFTVDTINFSFWSDTPFSIQYLEQQWTGYWSMVAAINRTLDEDIPISTPTFWTKPEFTLDLVKSIFRTQDGTGVGYPLVAERYKVLKEAGEELANAGFTSFGEVVAQCDRSALRLVQWVTEHIPSYNDQFTYEGKPVKIFKRAQILAADIWACFEGRPFDDIAELTMFADYRVPQLLVELGTIRYSPALDTLINSKQELASGSRLEIEIRGCSIRAVDVIVDAINEQGEQKVNAVLVDFYLWDTAKEKEIIIECHRTRSVFY